METPNENQTSPAMPGCAPTAGSGSAAVRDLERHNAAWVKYFIKPVARFMRERGISEVRIKIGRDGKASYLLEPDAEWLGDSIQNVNVDLPDTAAQDSASKSNNPAVSG